MLAALLPLQLSGRRPWLDLYDGGLLAQRILSTAAASSDNDDDDTLLPLELWLAIAASVPLSDFATVCGLARTCHTLRPLSRHPELWEQFCRAAFTLPGHLPIDTQLRFYSWSWLSMFRRRTRLRFDGLYYVAVTKLLAGLNEGRGMKELNKDFYRPGGRWVTTYRVLRFFPCGTMFSYLCASHTPHVVLKAAQAVAADRPQSLTQRIKGACWGAYDAREFEPHPNGAPSRLGITARVLLFNEAYPNMVCRTAPLSAQPPAGREVTRELMAPGLMRAFTGARDGSLRARIARLRR